MEVRCEWGEEGINHHKDWAGVIIIVDVLSFSTCVDLITSSRSIVYPYRFKDESAERFSQEKKARLAVARGKLGFTLSPASLTNFPKDSALVLPSPNGATLSMLAQEKIVFAGCLRNASSVAKAAMDSGKKIAVIPAGERWENNSLRVCYEDLIGAGAIINAIQGKTTLEADLACSVFKNSAEHKFKDLVQCVSALELSAHGYLNDVEIACEYDVSYSAPILQDGYYIDWHNASH